MIWLNMNFMSKTFSKKSIDDLFIQNSFLFKKKNYATNLLKFIIPFYQLCCNNFIKTFKIIQKVEKGNNFNEKERRCNGFMQVFVFHSVIICVFLILKDWSFMYQSTFTVMIVNSFKVQSKIFSILFTLRCKWYTFV